VSKVLGFEHVKGLYENNEDFKEILEKGSKHAHGLFHMGNGFLFRGTQLCIPKNGVGELLIQELHGGALAGHHDIEKTFLMMKECCYWSRLSNIVEHYVKR